MADQLQREIEEILSKLDDFIPEQKATSRIRKRWGEKVSGLRQRLGGVSARVSRVSAGHLMIASLVLIFIAFAFRSSAVSQYSMIAGLSLLGLTIVFSFLSNRRLRAEKRWRGEIVDLSEPGLLDRLQDWLKKRRSHTR